MVMDKRQLQRVMVVGLLMVAAVFVIAGYNRDLPIAELDEGILLSQTIRDRGLDTFSVFTVSGYPPVILALFTGTQLVTEAVLGESVLNHAGLVLEIVRILAIFANLVTVYLLYRIGAHFGLPLVGLVSAVLWAALPLVNKQASQALTEPWQLVFITAAGLAMLKALEGRSMRLALLCTVLGLCAVLSKYNNFPVLGFGVGASLWMLFSQPRKVGWGATLLVQGVMIAACAYVLWFVYGAQDLLAVGRPEISQFADGGLSSLVNPATIGYIFSVVAQQAGLPHVLVLVGIIVVGYVLMLRAQKPDERVALVYMLIFCVTFIWMVPTYLVYDVLKFRYVSSASSMVVLLTALSLWHMVDFVAQKRKNAQTAPALFLLVAAIWFVPAAYERLIEVRNMTLRQTGQAVVEWSSASLEPGATLAVTGLEGSEMRWRFFNNVWGDYTGPTRPLVNILLYLQEPKSRWRDAGIDYVHLTGGYPGDFPILPFARDEMLLLKAFPPQGEASAWHGDAWYIYRLDRYETPSDLVFGEGLRLVGYDLSDTTVAAGDRINLQTFWQALQAPAANYHIFVHLSELDEHTVLAQVDGTPGLATRPTSTWTDEAEVLVSPEYALTVPAELDAGTYRLLFGVYDPATGVRLMTPDGRDVVEFASVTIREP